MAKEKFTRTKPHVNVGTIGHIDHGKTLTAAIAGAVDQGHGQVHGLQRDRQGAGGEGARHHHRHRPCRVDRQPALCPRGLPWARRYIKNMITGAARWTAPSVVAAPTDPCRRPRAHPARPPGRRAGHGGVFSTSATWSTTRAHRAGRDGTARAARQVRFSW